MRGAPFRFAPLRWFLVLIALFYTYGALVHVLNMAGASGFDWRAAPIKWQALDVIYLVVDIAVAAGLLLRRVWAIWLFAAAGLSQILLYTVFRAWIVDVPEAFAVSTEQLTYLDGLVAFHLMTLALTAGLLAWWRKGVG